MSHWSASAVLLEARFPEVLKRCRAAPSGGGQEWLSPDDSRHVAARWLGDRRWKDGVVLAVSGWGDGEHLRALLKVLPDRAAVFVAERDAGMLREAIGRFDVADLLSDPRVMLGTGEPDDTFFGILDQVALLEITDAEPLVFAPSFNPSADYYAGFFTEFVRQIDFRRKLFGTAIVDAALWQANTFANLPNLGPAPDVRALEGAFAGKPLVLVSAGPSLDESLDFVGRASARAVVVAVNSSYRAVRNAGIVPHFVLAADPREYTDRGFADAPTDGTWLVTTPIVFPEVVRRFEGRCFTWSGSNVLFTEIRRRCGLAPGTALVEQGTVSACAVDLAALLGCDRVCLVGQDLAIREDGRSHARDTFYTDLGVNRTAVEACRRLPGNTIPEVAVEEKLYVYLKTFEQLVAQRPKLRFLNTSRLGAKIAGVPYACFDEALVWLGFGDMAGVFATIAARASAEAATAMSAARILAALESTRVFADDVLRLALQAAWAIENLPDRCAAENYRDARAVRNARARAAALQARLRAHPREQQILENGRTRLELFQARETWARVQAGSDHWRELQRAKEFAWAVAEGAWFLASRLRGTAAACRLETSAGRVDRPAGSCEKSMNPG